MRQEKKLTQEIVKFNKEKRALQNAINNKRFKHLKELKKLQSNEKQLSK